MNMLQSVQQLMSQFSSPEKAVRFLVNNRFKGNPIVGNLMNMAESGNQESLESFAQNLFKEQGRDFNKEFSDFMGNFK